MQSNQFQVCLTFPSVDIFSVSASLLFNGGLSDGNYCDALFWALFPGHSVRNVRLSSHLYLLRNLRLSGAIPPFSLNAIRAVQGECYIYNIQRDSNDGLTS